MSEEQRLLVYGAGGHGKVVADVGVSSGFVLTGFIDDDESRQGTQVAGAPVLTWAEVSQNRAAWAHVPIALGVGDNAARESVFRKLRAAGFTVVTTLHRASVLAPSAVIGLGSVAMAGVVVNPDARVGQGSILNTGCVVEHDVILGDFVHLSPNAALGGGVQIGARTHLGLGAVVLPLVRIGADVRVGAGAVVLRDVPDGVTVVGVPARAIH